MATEIRSYTFANILIFGIYFTLPFSIAIHSVFLLLFITYFLTDLLLQRRSLKLNEIQIAFLLIFCLALVALFWTEGTEDRVWDTVAKYAKFFYLVLISLFLARDQSSIRLAIYSIIFSMCLIVLSTILNIWIILPWSNSSEEGLGGNLIIMNDHIVQGLFTALLIVFCVSRIFSRESPYIKIAWGVIALAATFSVIYLLKGRTGFFALLGAMLFIGINLKMRLAIGGYKIYLTIFLFLLFAYTSPLLSDRLIEAYLEYSRYEDGQSSSIGHRLYNIKSAIAIFYDSPFLGFGTGSYGAKACEYIKLGIDCTIFNRHPHNQFLLFAIEFGLLGLILMLWLIYVLYLYSRSLTDVSLGVFAFGFLGIFIVDSFVNSSLFSSFESQLFCYIFAALAAIPRSSDDIFLLSAVGAPKKMNSHG